MPEVQLKSAEFNLYTGIAADLERLHRSSYYDAERRQELIDDLELLRDCTEWPALRKRIGSDLCRLAAKDRVRSGVRACAKIGAELGL